MPDVAKQIKTKNLKFIEILMRRQDGIDHGGTRSIAISSIYHVEKVIESGNEGRAWIYYEGQKLPVMVENKYEDLMKVLGKFSIPL